MTGSLPAARAAWLLTAATGAAAVAVVVWAGAALLTATHGFDITDEGFYLLSYRWWNVELRTFTGAQYFYGPVFQLLGYQIPRLRWFRLVTVLASHALFGWAFMSWLAGRRPAARVTRWWRSAGAAAIVACGGMAYSWLPFTPSYNDVSLLGATIGAALVLVLARRVESGRAPGVWPGVALGAVVAVMMIAKWASSVLTLLVLAAAAVVVVRPARRWQVGRLAGQFLAGALAVLGVLHLFVVPLDQALPQLITTNRLVAANTNSPSGLFRLYLQTTGIIGAQAVRDDGLLILAAVLAVAVRLRWAQWLAATLAIVGAVVAGYEVSSAKQWQGGALHVARYPVALAGLLLVGLALGLSVVVVERIRAVGSSLPRDGARGVVVLAMLVLLPLTEAAGTGNAILRMAFNGLALWAAVLIAVVTGIERAAPVARLLGKAALAATVGLATIISATASWAFPYRSPGHDVTSEATSLPALRGLTLEPATAGQFDRLYAALAPYRSDVARPIMGFDEVPGLVLALDGRSVGEAWYSHVDRGRTMAGIAAACAAGPPRSWAGQLPLLLVTARLTTGDVAALRACHIGFANDYRRLALVGGLPRVSVYVPTTVAAR